MLRRFRPADLLVMGYAGATGVLVAVFHENISRPGPILGFHVLLIVVILMLPPRGSAWETAPSGAPAWRRHLRGGLRFLRYAYPMLLVLPFFEEVEQTVNAVWPRTPYWFEPYLYRADRWLFGELPVFLLHSWVNPLVTELMHGFYFSYYVILVAGPVTAWLGGKHFAGRPPAPGFETTLTAAMASFFLCFIWYPFLPARGPWENPALMEELTPFRGFVFTPLIESIIAQGAVSGGCFPSSHVGGSWGIVLGLAGFRPRAAFVLGLLAVGMSFSCVYTRYHHAVDVPAGFACGLAGALIARGLVRESKAPTRE